MLLYITCYKLRQFSKFTSELLRFFIQVVRIFFDKIIVKQKNNIVINNIGNCVYFLNFYLKIEECLLHKDINI